MKIFKEDRPVEYLKALLILAVFYLIGVCVEGRLWHWGKFGYYCLIVVAALLVFGLLDKNDPHKP